MTVTLADVLRVIESLAPTDLAEKWDNVGLQVGRRDWPVRMIWVALDPLPDVVAAACKKDVDLIITHHPLIFNPLKSIDFGNPIGSIIQTAARHQTAIFTMHTNLDSAVGGTNDILADKIGLKNLKILGNVLESDEKRGGPGRIGELEHPMKLSQFAKMIKEKLKINILKIAGKPNLRISKAALCTGSGSSLMNDFISSGAQVYISGDLRYHDARVVESLNLSLIDIGHFSSEHLVVDVLADRLNQVLYQAGIEATVEAYGLERDPFEIV